MTKGKQTDLDILLRTIRLENREKLHDMGKRLGYTAAFISAIENGRRQPPDGFAKLVASHYGLSDEEHARLRRAEDRARETFKIKPESDLAREVTGAFARSVNAVPESELRQWLHRLELRSD